jgi:putative membrane protein
VEDPRHDRDSLAEEATVSGEGTKPAAERGGVSAVTREGVMTEERRAVGDRLAVTRTRLAHDRTLMAWVRTAASFISFGFSIYKFFDALRQSDIAGPPHGVFGPREFALAMIATGVGVLALATIDHRRGLAALRKEFGEDGGQTWSLSGLMAGVVVVLGTIGLILVFLRQ